jgi:hypothetical protein
MELNVSPMLTRRVFADDARQYKPSRRNTGPLAAIGGVYVSGDAVGPLERAIDELCANYKFPNGEQFKWSPGKKEKHMKTVVIGDRRLEFYVDLLTIARRHNASAFVIVEDVKCKTARRDSETHEVDLTALFLERSNKCFQGSSRDGLVIISAPSGGSVDEDKFLANCIKLKKEGTDFSDLENLPLGVITVNSQHIRLLQLADIVVSSVTSRVSGESGFSPAIFEMIKPIFRKDMDRIGGVGLKIHPDFKYCNLYHWLLGDTHIIKAGGGIPLPIKGLPFSNDSGEAAYELR